MVKIERPSELSFYHIKKGVVTPKENRNFLLFPYGRQEKGLVK